MAHVEHETRTRGQPLAEIVSWNVVCKPGFDDRLLTRRTLAQGDGQALHPIEIEGLPHREHCGPSRGLAPAMPHSLEPRDQILGPVRGHHADRHTVDGGAWSHRAHFHAGRRDHENAG